MVIFHKYFLFVKTFNQDFTKYLTCFSCIFISLKISNIILSLEDLLKIFLKMYYKEDFKKINVNNELISALSKKVFQIEFDILNVIGFDINIDLPYDYIFLMRDYFIWNFQPEILQQVKLIIISFINDSFKLPLCLYYHPLLIYLACLNLLSQYFNFELKEKDGIKWFNLIERNVSYEDINEISNKIRVIYDYSNENKNTNIDKDKNLSEKEKLANPNKKIENKFSLDFTLNKSNNINNAVNKVIENKKGELFSAEKDKDNENYRKKEINESESFNNIDIEISKETRNNIYAKEYISNCSNDIFN